MSDQYVGVGEAGQMTGRSPKAISNGFWSGRLDRKRCVLRAGRLWIEASYLDEMAALLVVDRRKKEHRRQAAS
jgi:hypothetical protein